VPPFSERGLGENYFDSHSDLSAIIASTLVTRRAETQQAKCAIPARRTSTAPIVSGSRSYSLDSASICIRPA
jgi:hypothetical protein